jgi:dTDP-4-amino-4,6-dideoxygalactose transaminase
MINLFRPRYEVEECLSAIRQVLEKGWTGQGPKCQEFENAWKDFIGAPNAHFVSSATAALHIAVRLLDLPKGSKVATTPITFVSSNAVLLYEGLEPVFCDIGADLSLSFNSVKTAIEEKGAKAVMWVHYGGSISEDFYDLMKYANEHKIPVIEDCAHAAGAFYRDGTRVGSRKDTISCFSYHSVKNLPIMDGGMICVPNQEAHNRATRLSWMGIDKSTYARTGDAGNEVYKWSYDVPELGWKYNGNDIAASIGLVQLKYLDQGNAYRKLLYERYINNLIGMPRESDIRVSRHSEGSSHHLLVVKAANRDTLIAALKLNGIAPGVHYLPNYRFPVFARFDHGACENVEKESDQLVSLPNHLCLAITEVDTVCRIIKSSGHIVAYDTATQ